KVLPTVKVNITPQVSVVLSSGLRLMGEVKKYSPPVSAEPGTMSGRDLALLKLPDGNYPVLSLADSTAVQIGDPLRILGFPGVVLSHELLNQSASVEASVNPGAVSGFKQDKANNPVIQTGLSDVKRMLGEAVEKVKNPPPKPFPWFWVTIGVTLVSAGGYGGQLLVRWQKNRYRVGPSEIFKLAEAGKPPIVLDTRQQDAYDKMPIKIPGSIRLAPEDLKSGGAAGLDLDTARPVVAYCT